MKNEFIALIYRTILNEQWQLCLKHIAYELRGEHVILYSVDIKSYRHNCIYEYIDSELHTTNMTSSISLNFKSNSLKELSECNNLLNRMIFQTQSIEYYLLISQFTAAQQDFYVDAEPVYQTLTSAFEILWQQNMVQLEKVYLYDFVSSLGFSVLHLDKQSNILQQNSEADKLIEASQFVSACQGKLFITPMQFRKQFNSLLSRCFKNKQNRRPYFMRLKCSEGNVYSLMLLCNEQVKQHLFSNEVVMCVIKPMNASVPINLNFLHSCYQLSSTEEVILIDLVNGKNLKAIATEHSLSYHTVRWHLKSIFKKFDVHKQTDLIESINNDLLMRFR